SVTAIALTVGCTTSSVSRAFARWGLRGQRVGRRKLSDVVELELCQRYAAGASTRALAREFDIAPMTVTDIARRHHQHVYPRGGRFQATPAQVEQVLQLWHQGASQSAIARQLAMHQSSVS